MIIQVLTLFPNLFENFTGTSLIHKAISLGVFSIDFIQIRDFSEPPHYQVDDIPYGGGAGMVMKPEPLYKATIFAKTKWPKSKVILLSPKGIKFKQSKAKEYAQMDSIIFVCARYEGVDQRYIDLCVDEEVSIGDYILMGGEVASMVIIEAVTRLIPGVIGNQDSLKEESFSEQSGALEYPHYTRPKEFMNLEVPNVLLSGDHKKIVDWRKEQSKELTRKNRPDLT